MTQKLKLKKRWTKQSRTSKNNRQVVVEAEPNMTQVALKMQRKKDLRRAAEVVSK